MSPVYDNQETGNSRDKGGRKSRWTLSEDSAISIKSTAYFLGLLITIATTFLATRANLSDRLLKLETRVGEKQEIRDHLDEATIYTLINSLRVLEDQVKDLAEFVKQWKRPSFAYEKLPVPPGMPFPGGVPEVLSKRTDRPDMPTAFDLSVMNSVILDPRFRAIEDRELVSSGYKVSQAMSRYNSALLNATSAIFGASSTPYIPGYGSPVPALKPRARREEVEEFITVADAQMKILTGLLMGLPERVAASRDKLERIVTNK